ncbi:MAG: NAD-dependent epimerase/dehydratase family protein [Polaribacter sp.]|nr:NAD-dependent epimerase/dehydratase family protein [Polaribacter sp.]MDC1374096.1 NAD-dependent epimerase/dehydratase family protein [Polaribacter sp.]MDG1321579.1 NAD-dependent epimerase/dehydratase family protein [Polaribacter sp.]
MKECILILGACGQIGTELTQKLRSTYGNEAVIASDIRQPDSGILETAPFEILDASNKEAILKVVQKHQVTQVYLLAAMLSVTAEKYPEQAWRLNMNSILAVLDLAKEKHIQKIYWPSSIAVFGPTTPKINTRQKTIMEPSTVYGISKLAGEFWCNYYHQKYDVDVRSLRYPGIISWKTKPGGGTTDYAVDIYFKAVKDRKYKCYLSKDTRLPMMYMEDAVNATIALMQADRNRIKIRTSYNLAAIDFTPEEISEEIKKHLPDFEISYQPDFRQKIADSWPQSIDDSDARIDWDWQHEFNLETMTKDILYHIQKK